MPFVDSHTAMHAGSPGSHKVNVAGRIVVSFLVFFFAYVLLKWLEVSSVIAVSMAIAFWLCFEMVLFFFRAARLKHLRKQSIDLQTKRHELEEQALALEVQKAKQSGAFEKFGQSK